MISIASAFWISLGILLHILGAVATASVAMWLLARRERFGRASVPIIAALMLTCAWCVTFAANGHMEMNTSLVEAARNIAWLVAIYWLFAGDGRHERLAPIRPVILVLGLVEVLTLAVGVLFVYAHADATQAGPAFTFMALCRLLVAVGSLVLVHNLYAGASEHSRAAMRWPASALAVLLIFDLNIYTIAYLSREWPDEIVAARGIGAVLLAALFLVGASKQRQALRFRPSRAVTFQTFSLLVIGLYLIAMVAIGQLLAYAGGDFARMMELGFLTAASVAAVLLLPSRRLRGWLKVTLAKHFFQHRYDYREEWLRFARTIGQLDAASRPLGERVVQALADITESPAGLLLEPDDDGAAVLAARWNWPEIEVPATAMPAETALAFGRTGFIAAIDETRAGEAAAVEGSQLALPGWLLDHPRAWAIVPLVHFERLVGLVVLARPPQPRPLDWEDFDMLRVVGQQLATYLAENTGQQALAEASRFDDFHRRIAFVMHDIKNLASQLALLARNAELHAEKKEFRDDMLVTLRNAADKLNALIARLSRYGNGGVDGLAPVQAGDVARSVAARFGRSSAVHLTQCEELAVMANADSLEQVLIHLIQNGLDASAPGTPVFMALTRDDLAARFEIVDSGCGMSPEFVRGKLFKPFESTKSGGFGIGAFEARELVRAMRGQLEVESREGLGTRFVVRLPLAAAAELYETLKTENRKVAP